jgi:hypothetical protein
MVTSDIFNCINLNGKFQRRNKRNPDAEQCETLLNNISKRQLKAVVLKARKVRETDWN